MLGDVFERFIEKSPISVMVRATLERVLGADRLDLWYERTAEKQYTRELLFSTVYDSSALNRGHEHQRSMRRWNARDGRPRRFGGAQRGSGT